ncbi:hypothetical protein Tco_0735140 [Tanacetum coccineum]
MSSATSAVSYTSVYTDFEPGRAFWEADDEEVSEGGIPWVITPPVPQDEDEHEPISYGNDPDYVPIAYIPEGVRRGRTEDGPVELSYGTEGLNGDDDDDDSSRDDANDMMRIERGRSGRDEDEHLTPRSTIVVPTSKSPSTRGTMTTPSPSPPILLSPPSAGERLAMCTTPPAHSPPPPVPSPLLPSSGFTAALPSSPLPPLPPSLYIPPPVDHRDDILESEQPPRKSTVDAEVRWQGISDVGYGIKDTWADPAEAVPEIAPMIVGEVNTRVTELVELHEHDTQDLYALLEDAQDSRSRISQRVDMDSQRVDLLMRDRMTLQETV